MASSQPSDQPFDQPSAPAGDQDRKQRASAAESSGPNGDGPQDDEADAGTSQLTPPVPADSGQGRRIVFDQSDQRVWLVDDDESVVRTYLVSVSLTDNLDPGTYSV